MFTYRLEQAVPNTKLDRGFGKLACSCRGELNGESVQEASAKIGAPMNASRRALTESRADPLSN
eukprot:3369651-Alexandrium_andersonii.AAC.1